MAQATTNAPAMDYVSQIMENCRFVLPDDSDIQIVTSKEPGCGKFRAAVTKTDGHGRKKKRTVFLISEPGATMPEAFELLHAKSAEAMHNHLTALGYGIVPSRRSGSSGRSKMKVSAASSSGPGGWANNSDAGSGSDSQSESSSESDDDSDKPSFRDFSDESLSDAETISIVGGGAKQKGKKGSKKQQNQQGPTSSGPRKPIINVGPKPPMPRMPRRSHGFNADSVNSSAVLDSWVPPAARPPPGVFPGRIGPSRAQGPGFVGPATRHVGPLNGTAPLPLRFGAAPPPPPGGYMPPHAVSVPISSLPGAQSAFQYPPPGAFGSQNNSNARASSPAAQQQQFTLPGSNPPLFAGQQVPSFAQGPTPPGLGTVGNGSSSMRDFRLVITWAGHDVPANILSRCMPSKRAIGAAAVQYVAAHRDAFGSDKHFGPGMVHPPTWSPLRHVVKEVVFNNGLRYDLRSYHHDDLARLCDAASDAKDIPILEVLVSGRGPAACTGQQMMPPLPPFPPVPHHHHHQHQGIQVVGISSPASSVMIEED